MAATTTAYIGNVENLVKLFRLGKYTGFILKDGQENHIYTFGKDYPATTDEAINALEEALSGYDSGRFIVEGKQGFENADAKKATRWFLSLNVAPNSAAAIAGQPGQVAPNAFQLMELLFAERLENALLKKEREHQQPAGITGNPSLDKLIETAVQNLPQIMGYFMGKVPQPPAMAGPFEEHHATADEVQAVEEALSVLISVNPDFIDKLQKIAAFAKANPERFKSGFGTILNMLA